MVSWWLRHRDYIPTLFLSAQEALVHTAAHELRHVLQIMSGSCIISDIDADMYAIREQRDWRRLNNKELE
jgi:predicted Zn-dependent protease